MAVAALAATVTPVEWQLVMSDVRIADLKARLSEHLRTVRNGGTLTVLDRDTPVARIVPYAAPPLEVRKAQRRARDLKLRLKAPAPSTGSDFRDP
jgi:prevent-host-death family protein